MTIPAAARADLALIEWMEAQFAGKDALGKPVPTGDLAERAPGITLDEAYALQIALRERAVARGDRQIGYKAALTSKAIQQNAGIHEPYFGCLMASGLFDETQPVSLKAAGHERGSCIVEQEVAVLLKRDLRGPGCTRAEALATIEGYLPAIELGEGRTPQRNRSLAMSIAGSKFTSGILVGQPLTPPAGIDLRLEGMTLFHNGVPVSSGTGVEVLGDPLNSVVAMADKYATFGETLRAGMLLMTGSFCGALRVVPHDRVRVSFTRLGSIEVTFVA